MNVGLHLRDGQALELGFQRMQRLPDPVSNGAVEQVVRPQLCSCFLLQVSHCDRFAHQDPDALPQSWKR